MGIGRGFSRIVLAAATLALAMPAAAQFSDSYSFLKAVKDADGEKAMTYLDKPGQPVLNARDSGTGDTALHIVIRRHDMTWLGFLIGRGAQTELRDRDGNTPLMTAVQLSDAAATRLLLQAGAKPNAANSRGETPLIIAVQHRDLPIIRMLLAEGADPKIPDTIAGKSAHDYAAEDRRSDTVLKLLDETKPKPAKVISGPVRP